MIGNFNSPPEISLMSCKNPRDVRGVVGKERQGGTNLDPFVVARDIVGAETDQLYVSLVEFSLVDGSGAELGGADG
jgi:hypothetical protein